MKIIPIAFDSFGVRSMATFVKTKDILKRKCITLHLNQI